MFFAIDLSIRLVSAVSVFEVGGISLDSIKKDIAGNVGEHFRV